MWKILVVGLMTLSSAWARPPLEPARPAVPAPAQLPSDAPAAQSAALPPSSSSDCGLSPEVAPEFELIDENPQSPTYGQTFRRSDFLDRVMVIYWAYAP